MLDRGVGRIGGDSLLGNAMRRRVVQETISDPNRDDPCENEACDEQKRSQFQGRACADPACIHWSVRSLRSIQEQSSASLFCGGSLRPFY